MRWPGKYNMDAGKYNTDTMERTWDEVAWKVQHRCNGEDMG